MEPNEKNTDYKNHMSAHLQSIENAVNLCVERGVKVEFVMWHTPRWASVSGNAGPWRPKTGLHAEFVSRIAEHFKGRVDEYQVYHEENLQGMKKEADPDFIIEEIYKKEDKAVCSI